MDEVRVCDLGPLEVAHGEVARPCAGPKQAAILATLAMNLGHRVPVDDLVVGAWGYDAVVSTSTVENHVWRLRRLLDPAYSRSSGSVLVNDSGGYRLHLGPQALDSEVFATMAEEAGAALAEDHPLEALARCDRALTLWRGTPYDVVAHVSATAAVTARLEEIRGQVVERRVEALIRCGRRDDALADLEVLTARFPYRERLWAHQMTALAGSGRAEEALQSYQRVRSLLREELGIDPGPELQRLHAQVLAAELPPATGSTDVAAAPVEPLRQVHLPRRSLPLLGREAEVQRLVTQLETDPLVTLTGPGGSGKTRLAIEVARRVAPRFVDGVWFVDLTTVSDPGLVADAVTSTLGLTAAGADALAVLGAYTVDRDVLLLLDNCEHVLDGVAAVAEAMVVPDSRSVLLLTSRQPLAADGERVCDLAPLSVQRSRANDHPEVSWAAQLFLARLGRAEASPDEVAVVEEICRAVDGLPLAIELAAARAQAFTLEEIRAQVSEDPIRLGRIGRRVDDHRTTLWSTIDWSHRLLDSPDRATHRRLAALPGPFTLPAATAVAQGPDLEVEEVPAALARLVHRSLLVSSPPAVAGRSTVFRQLDTVRAHAAALLADTGEHAATTARRDRFVLQLIDSRPRLGHPAERAFFDNIDDHFPAVRATLQSAVTRAPAPELLLAGCALHFHSFYRHGLVERRSWARSVAKAATWGRDAEPLHAEVVLFRVLLASGELIGGDVALAQEELDRALPHVGAVPDHLLLDLGTQLAGAAQSGWARNEYAITREVGEVMRDLADRSGDPQLHLLADQVACFADILTRDPQETAAQAEALYDRAVAADNLLTQWTACTIRVVTAQLAGDADDGLLWIDRLLPAHVHLGTGGGGVFLESLGNLAAMSGDHALAIRMHAAGYAETRRAGMVWPIQPATSELIAHTRSAVDPDTYGRLWSEGAELTYEQVVRERGVAPTL